MDRFDYDDGVGKIGLHTSERNYSPWRIILCFFISLAILAAYFYFTPLEGLPLLAIAVVYLLMGYFINPRPDYNNMGWLGGLIDDPFQFSDGYNRFLAFLKFFLLPGRFMAQSLVDFFGIFTRSV